MIAVDNTIWSGKILSDQFQDKDTMAIKALNDFVPTDNRVESTLLNMADGVLLAIKK
jgi:O-methyltransferase